VAVVAVVSVVAVAVVWAVTAAKKTRMRVNPDTNHNNSNNNKRYIFKTEYTRGTPSHHLTYLK
jgi:hypothetical protein